jgi:hypothetical protein
MRPVCIQAVTGQQNADGRGTPTRRDSVRVRGFATWLGLEAGSDEVELLLLLFLLGPGQRKVSREPGDGQVSRRAAFRDGLNDARRQIGKRRQEADLALFGETTVILSPSAAAFDSMIG